MFFYIFLMIFNYLFGCPSTFHCFILSNFVSSSILSPFCLRLASDSLYISSIYILRIIRKSSSFNDPSTFLIIQSNLSIYLPISYYSLFILYRFLDCLLPYASKNSSSNSHKSYHVSSTLAIEVEICFKFHIFLGYTQFCVLPCHMAHAAWHTLVYSCVCHKVGHCLLSERLIVVYICTLVYFWVLCAVSTCRRVFLITL